MTGKPLTAEPRKAEQQKASADGAVTAFNVEVRL
jgi:hypothetical protein